MPQNNSCILEVQQQLAKTLIAQAVIPLITFCVPANIMFVTVFFEINIPECLSTVLGMMLNVMPLGNAFSILFFVKVYRTFVIQFLKEVAGRIRFQYRDLSTYPNATAPTVCSEIMSSIHTSDAQK